VTTIAKGVRTRTSSDPARYALANKRNDAQQVAQGSEKAKQYQVPSLNSLLSVLRLFLQKVRSQHDQNRCENSILREPY
jgi:hypothetical protein